MSWRSMNEGRWRALDRDDYVEIYDWFGVAVSIRRWRQRDFQEDSGRLNYKTLHRMLTIVIVESTKGDIDNNIIRIQTWEMSKFMMFNEDFI